MFHDATPYEPEGDDAWEPPAPDSLDLVVEVADMMAIFAAQRLERVDALRCDALADAERHGYALTEVLDRSVRLELAAALRITEYAAGDLLTLAEAVVHRYPSVLESLSRAQMTEQHARVLVHTMDEIEPGSRERILPKAVELAETHAVGTFRRALRKLVETVRYDTLAERHEAAVQARRIVAETSADGMGWLHLHLPAVEIHATHERVTAIAKVLGAQEGETRTLDQLRADVVADLLIDGDTTVHPNQARGIRATVVVTVPVLALLDENGTTGDPAVVEGVGPIPMDRARELCGGADGWMRVLTHPETGMVLSVGRDQYRVPAPLRRLVKWRADRCMAPGCGMPASRCEIDHQLAWEDGGHTCLENNAPFCKGHHIVKHRGRWVVRQIPGSGGAIEWISPAGRRYVVKPERRVPVFRPPDHPPPDSGPAPF